MTPRTPPPPTPEPTLPGFDPDPDEVDPRTVARENWGTIDALLAQGRQFTRKASRARCPQCRAEVLTGSDATTMGAAVTVDPVALAPDDEAVCRMSGRGLYTLRVQPDRIEIDYRDEWATPGTHTRPVVPHHLCGHPFPGHRIDLARLAPRPGHR